MGLERVVGFGREVAGLWSFPVFLAYLTLVFCGRVWGRICKPLELKRLMVVYNMVCSLVAVVTLCGFVYGVSQTSSLYDMTPSATLKPYYKLYWASKLLELLDTVFMVLRHKSRQITFLHVFHHASMLVLSDYAFHFTPWAAIAIGLALNSLIHVVLYFYYGLTALDPEATRSWKRRVTELQIAQFVLDLMYASVGYMYHGFCIYCLLYGLMMISLFSNFYYKAYLSPKARSKKDS